MLASAVLTAGFLRRPAQKLLQSTKLLHSEVCLEMRKAARYRKAVCDTGTSRQLCDTLATDSLRKPAQRLLHSFKLLQSKVSVKMRKAARYCKAVCDTGSRVVRFLQLQGLYAKQGSLGKRQEASRPLTQNCTKVAPKYQAVAQRSLRKNA